MSKSIPKWNEERAAQLLSIVGNELPVSLATVAKAAEALETSPRSVASKLRKLNFEVELVSSERSKTFTDSEAEEIKAFVLSNSGVYTYAEIAAAVCGGKFSPKAIQGKILSMELTAHVKPTPKVEAVKQYSEDEEAKFIKLANAGKFLEEIAEALGKSLNSVRGKALSLSRSVEGFSIPKQKSSHASVKEDALEALGDISKLSVKTIAEKIGKTERGVKTMLTHRKLACVDYDGAKKAEKIAEKQAA